MPYPVLSPLNSMGKADLSLRQNLTVGQPWISRPEISFSVESTLASMMLGLLAIILAASSKWGARCLQCPHQGAQNFTKTSFDESRTYSLKVLPTSTFTGSSLDSGMGADFKNQRTSPLLTLLTNSARPSTVISPWSYLYFLVSELRQSTEGVGSLFTPRYSPSLSQRPLPSFLVETERMTLGLVRSQDLNVCKAAASTASSAMKRNRAD